jgi:hypothetical protein
VSDKSEGDDWIACICTFADCKATILLEKVSPSMRDARGQVHIVRQAERVTCPQCKRVAYYSTAQFGLVRHPVS